MPDTTTPVFTVGDSDREHEVGNPNCPACWRRGYELDVCRCGGLIHTSFGDENYDGDYWLYYRCDKCGSDESPEAGEK